MSMLKLSHVWHRCNYDSGILLKPNFKKDNCKKY